MAIVVTPGLWIDNRYVPCTADALDTAPLAIRGFTVTWGRSEYQDPSVSPASVKLTLLDATGAWAQRIRDSRAIGTPVEIRWTSVTTEGVGNEQQPVMFAGRVQIAEARPHTVHASDGRTAWTVELTCADRTADFGNAIAPPATWPRESMILRANRIRDLGLAAGSGIRQVYFWPGYVDTLCAPLDVKDQSALDLMAAMYASMGNDAYAYDPHQNVVRQEIRLSQPLSIGLGTFDTSHGAVAPVPGDITVDGQVYPGVALGGCELVGEPAVTADAATDINRLECAWKDFAFEHHDVTTVKENVNANDARRVMSWESWIDDGRAIDPTLENVWARAREEGRRPRHPDVTVPWTFTFATERLARWILSTWANTRPAYIAGSLPYIWLMASAPGYMPVVAPIGGETTWDPERGWSATLHVHWIHNAAGDPPPVTWSALEQKRTTTTQPTDPWWWPLLGIPPSKPVTVGSPTPARNLKWGDPELVPGYGWDTSVTWGDLRNVDNNNAQIKDILS